MNDVSKPKKNIPLYLVILTAAIVVVALFFILTPRVGEKAVITDYSVKTVYNIKECMMRVVNSQTGETGECQNWRISDEIETIPGFFKNLPDDAANPRYEVTFKVGNTAGEYLDVIAVKVIFCDQNDNELYSELTSLYDFPNSYVKESSVTISESSTNYFYNIEKVRFEIITD